ncbi:uncharacterized protein LAJ45_01507 [Morchella importuna]|uniref:uncharacterized protein n=1 Tax=Morchella importuna TaxID=1174673 RepID=UPI001E8E7214|nr:uncharacterized protein LAJ45_01507 [Morchella importuna]KAH8154974.1 hypothetical protein LAJ45_01507 [Morchella importuna]
MCMRVVERYAVCKCVYFTHGVDQCGAYGRRGHMEVHIATSTQIGVLAVDLPPHHHHGAVVQDPRSGFHTAPAMPASSAGERSNSQQQQQQQQQSREAPAGPAIEALQQRQEAARLGRKQEDEGRTRRGLLLTEGNITFYWRNYA